jgi:protoheme ferro-lyase
LYVLADMLVPAAVLQKNTPVKNEMLKDTFEKQISRAACSLLYSKYKSSGTSTYLNESEDELPKNETMRYKNKYIQNISFCNYCNYTITAITQIQLSY